MLVEMMRVADQMFTANAQNMQSVCAQYSLLPIEANVLTVYPSPLTPHPLKRCSHRVQFYTMDGLRYGLTTEDSVYYRFNSALRSRQPSEVEPWADFARIIDSALDKLPPREVTVYRGFHVSLTQVSHEYQQGRVVWLPSVTSATTDEKLTLKVFGSGSCSSPGTSLPPPSRSVSL
jgi:hypothetical protein